MKTQMSILTPELKTELIRRRFKGQARTEIAIALGRAPSTIKQWMKQIEPELTEMRDLAKLDYQELRFRLEEASENALDRIIYLVDNAKSEGIQFGAAQDVLDREGRLAKIQKVAQAHIVKIDDKSLMRLEQVLKEVETGSTQEAEI